MSTILGHPSAAVKWVAAITVKLPPPISANRFWRTRVVMLPGRDPIVQTYVSAEAKQFKESAGWLLRNAGMRAPITGRVRVDLQLWPHCPKDWKTRERKDPLWWADTVQRIDADNAIKVTLDALKGIAIEDDKQVWRTSVEVMEPDEGVDECVVVRISTCVKEHPQEALAL